MHKSCLLVVNDLVTKYKLRRLAQPSRDVTPVKVRDCSMLSARPVMKASLERPSSSMLYNLMIVFAADLPKALEMIQERLKKKEEVRVHCPPVVVVGMLQPVG